MIDLKCARCGWEGNKKHLVHKIGLGYETKVCPVCLGESLYNKKCWGNLKAHPINFEKRTKPTINGITATHFIIDDEY